MRIHRRASTRLPTVPPHWTAAHRATRSGHPLPNRSTDRIALLCVGIGATGLPVTVWLAFAGAPSSALTAVGAIAAAAISTAGVSLRRRW